MDYKDFEKLCIQSGIACYNDKQKLEAWYKNHPKKEYNCDDLVEIYEYLNSPKIGEYIACSKWKIMSSDVKTTKYYWHKGE